MKSRASPRPVARKGLSNPPSSTAEPDLLIVARDQPRLFRTLLQEFWGNPQLRVTLDRRHADRRRQALAVPVDRRRIERRSPPHIEEDLFLHQFILVRPHARQPQDWRLIPDR
jgi:hypothetical protein